MNQNAQQSLIKLSSRKISMGIGRDTAVNSFRRKMQAASWLKSIKIKKVKKEKM